MRAFMTMSATRNRRHGPRSIGGIDIPRRFGFVLLWLLIAAMPAHAALNGLTEVKLNADATGTELLFGFRAEPPVARSFLLESPNRLVLDFPGTVNSTGKNFLPYAFGMIGGVQVVESGDRTRAVINLTGPVNYETIRRDGNVIALILEPFATVEAAGRSRAIKNVDFRRGNNGQGLVEIRLGDPQTIVDVNRVGEQVMVEVRGTTVPESLQRLLDVIDFATPVRTVDALQRGPDTKLVITSSGEFVHSAYQTNDLFTVEIAPPPPPDVAEIPSADKEKEYSGERLSLNFQNIEIRAILQIIADFTGSSPQVRGPMNCTVVVVASAVVVVEGSSAGGATVPREAMSEVSCHSCSARASASSSIFAICN